MTAFMRLLGFSCVLIATVSCSTAPVQKEARFISRGKARYEHKEYSSAILEFRNASAAAPGDAEPHYLMGLALLGLGNKVSALSEFQAAVKLDPKHENAQLKSAEILAAAGNTGEAEQAVTTVESVFGSSPQNPEAILTMAVAEWRLGRPEYAEARLRESLERFPRHLESSVTLARIRTRAGDWAGAEKVLQDAAAQAPDSAAVHQALADFYAFRNDAAKAELEFEKALRISPDNGPSLMGLGAVQLAAKRMEEAERTYKKLAALPDAQYKPMHAIFLYESGRREQALAEFESLAKADPRDRLARTRLVAVYLAMHRANDAEALLKAAIEKNPHDADALIQLSSIHLRSGKLNEAQMELLDAVKLNPDKAEIHMGLAKTYRAKGMAGAERQELQEALRAGPAALDARLALVINLSADRQYKAALAVLDQAPSPQHNNINWIIARNWSLLALGDLKSARDGIGAALAEGKPVEAVLQDAVLRDVSHDLDGGRADLEELLRLDVTDPRVADLLVETYAARRQTGVGIAKVERLAAAHPESAGLNHLLGRWYVRTGQPAKALASFEKAKAADPNLVAVDLSIAELDIDAGQVRDAISLLQRTVVQHPSNTAAWLLLARAQEGAGDLPAATESYRTVLNIDGRNVVALNNVAYLLGRDNLDEAMKFAQKAAELAPASPNVQDTLGWVYYRKGLYSLAVPRFKAAVDKEPTPRREFHLGMAYIRSGQDVLGRRMVQNALQKSPEIAKTESGW